MSTARIAILGTGFRPSGGVEPPREIAAIAGASFRPELVEPRFNAFPKTPYDRGLTALGNLDAGISAEKNGYSAVFLNTFGDYGVTELRSALGIPVVGAGQMAMTVAATLGRRFSIVTVWPRTMNFIYDERLAACGMAGRCVGIRNILDDGEMASVERGDTNDPVTAMRAGTAAIVDRIVAATEIAVAADGADTIVLGCTCMAPIGTTVAARLRVPVIEPMTTGYKMAELLVSLGLGQSAAAFPKADPARLQIVDQLISGARVELRDENCPVCVFAGDQAAE
jgi:allantoin racemase